MSSHLIAILFEYSTLNGGERSMLAVLEWLKKHDRRLEFVAIAQPVGRLADALRNQGIAIQGWSPQNESGIRLGIEEIESSLCRVVATLRPSLLHANSLAMGRLSGRLSGRLELPTTSHLRDIIKLSTSAIADLNRNRRLVAVSAATRDFHVAQGIDEQRVDVIQNGIDLKRFQPRETSGWLHAELGLPYEVRKITQHPSIENVTLSGDREESSKYAQEVRTTRLIATIGQIGLRKGQDVLAAAAPLIVARVPDAHFLLVGERTSQKSESIEFERSIYKAFADAGLSDRLHVLGHREDVPQLLSEIDLLIHPANQEPFGRVLLEASAAGVPIVATNVGGTDEIVVNRLTGRLIPPKDSAALAAAVIDVLTDGSQLNSFRAAARERAVRSFHIGTAAERLKNLWSDIVDEM